MNKVKMINRQFGNEMLVAADRVDEYLAKGHKRYTPPKKPEPNPKPEPAPAPKAAPKKGRKKKSEKRD